MTEDPPLTNAERFDRLCAGNPQLGMVGLLRDLPRFIEATSAVEREPWVDMAKPFQASDLDADAINRTPPKVLRLLAANFGSPAEAGAAIATCRRYDTEQLGTPRRNS